MSLEGSGSEGDPFFLANEYKEPPVENKTPLPVHTPAYPGGMFAAKIQARECHVVNRHIHQEECHICRGKHWDEEVIRTLGSPIPTTHDPLLEEESLTRAGIGYCAELEREGLLREIQSNEEKNTLVETHEAVTQTPGARSLTIPNNAYALEMVLYHRDMAAYKTYTKCLQECAEEEACRINEHQEGHWWAVDEINNMMEFTDLD